MRWNLWYNGKGHTHRKYSLRTGPRSMNYRSGDIPLSKENLLESIIQVVKNKFGIVLLILILLLQIAPVWADGAHALNDAVQNPHASIYLKIPYQSQALINNENRASFFNHKSSRLSESFHQQTCYFGNSLLNPNLGYMIVDIRHENKRTLSSYFYESKYRILDTLI